MRPPLNRKVYVVGYDVATALGSTLAGTWERAVRGEATVKRLFHEDGTWRLQPENPAMDPIRVWDGDAEFRVAGKVIGVVRRF